MHNHPTLHLPDSLGPAIAAVVFVVIMSLVKEPARLKVNAVLVTGAVGVYLSGGLGPWELLYPAIAVPVVYRALGSHRFIGVGWLMHAGWDLVHHLYGNAIWPFMPTSSFGCMIFDAAIAIWFLAGAPTVLPLVTRGWLPAEPRGPGSGSSRSPAATSRAPR
jgi:Family of unknown function (DUF6010)